MMARIRFGTSGWRAIIADDFTFANVRLAARGVCEYLQSSGVPLGASLIAGYDTRFIGEHFADECVAEVTRYGFRALVCNGPNPTPVISCAIGAQKAAGGINFTASHNPPEYNGMKFSIGHNAIQQNSVDGRSKASIRRTE